MLKTASTLAAAVLLAHGLAHAQNPPVIGLITKTETNPFFVKMKEGAAEAAAAKGAKFMLKGIDPLLTPELLRTLAEMGHGDKIVVADANFTATTLARGKVLIALPGVGAQRCCEALLSLLPLDQAVAQPLACMQVCDTPPGYRSALPRRVIGRLEAAGWATPAMCQAVERFAFYERVQGAHAIVQTGELQPYANFILKKGVISEALEP